MLITEISHEEWIDHFAREIDAHHDQAASILNTGLNEIYKMILSVINTPNNDLSKTFLTIHTIKEMAGNLCMDKLYVYSSSLCKKLRKNYNDNFNDDLGELIAIFYEYKKFLINQQD